MGEGLALTGLGPEEQERVYRFLAERARKYTGASSTSLPLEAAQELFASTLFCLGLDQDGGPETWRVLLAGDLNEAYEAGLCRIEGRLACGKRLWQAVCGHMPPVENQSMLDTLESIGGFWKKYDRYFSAHIIPCDIDYQLSDPVPDSLLGVDYVNGYLERLAVENTFLCRFQREDMLPVLKRYCPDYRGLLVNLFEPIAAHAVALALLGENVQTLRVAPGGRKRLEALLARRTEGELEALLRRAGERAAMGLGLHHSGSVDYLARFAQRLAPRLGATALDGVFLLEGRGE